MNKFLFLIFVLTTCLFESANSQALTDPNPGKSITVCNGKNELTYFSLLPVFGGAGNYNYKWEQTNDTTIARWTYIQNQGNPDISVNYSATTYLRRVTSDRGATVRSGIIRYIVLPPLLGGQITSGEVNICNGDSFTLKVLILPSGADGNINYEWWYSNDSDDFATGSKALIYNTGKVYGSNSYVLRSYSPYCKINAYSNPFLINGLENIKTLKLRYIKNQVHCSPTLAFKLQGDSLNLTTTYSWQSLDPKDLIWKTIITSSKSSCNPGFLNKTTFFRRIINSNYYCGYDTSNVITIQIGNTSPYLVKNVLDSLEPSCGMFRYAILKANQNQGTKDTIIFDLPKNQLNIINLQKPLVLNEDIIIKGPGMDNLALTNQQGNVFNHEALINQKRIGDTTGTIISGLTFKNSINAIVDTNSDLKVIKCKFDNNTQSSNIPGGAGIYFNKKNLIIDSCIFIRNSSTNYYNNSEPLGGAVHANSVNGIIKISNSTFDKNYLVDTLNIIYGRGGAMYLTGKNFKTIIEKSTFSNNNASIGGSIFHSASSTISDSTNIKLCTFSGNKAGNLGGALLLVNGSYFLESNTITNNGIDSITGQRGEIINPSGGGIYAARSNLILENNILAGNHSKKGEDIFQRQTITISNGGNLFGLINNYGDTIKTHPTDIYTLNKRTDPVLTPLGFYGGLTKTHLPLSISPVVDKGVVSSISTTDQRGLKRVVGSAQDIGSVEIENPCNNPFEITTTADTMICGSLTYAVYIANLKKGSDTITFSNLLPPKPIFKLKSRLNINDGLLINGLPGSELVPVSSDNIMNINTKLPVSIKNLIFKNSNNKDLPALYTSVFNGSIYLKKVSFINNKSQGGKSAAFFSSFGITILDSCKFINNISTAIKQELQNNGGALQVALPDFQVFNLISITNTVFINNSAISNFGGRGGAIYLDLRKGANKVSIQKNSFINNTAINGGAIYSDSYGGDYFNNTFSSNKSSLGGGALYFFGGNYMLTNNTIFDNKISGIYSGQNGYIPASGGGIYLSNGTINLKNTIIANNSAPGKGKDIYNLKSTFIKSFGNNFISDTIQGARSYSGLLWKPSDILGDSIKIKKAKLQSLSTLDSLSYYHLPILGSLVIDKGDSTVDLKTDQRNLKRVVGKNTDIGSVESNLFFPRVFAGNDTATCDSITYLKAIPAFNGFRGYWSIKNKNSKGIIISDSTKSSTTSKLLTTTTFDWVVTDDKEFSDTDRVIKTRAPKVSIPVMQRLAEACSPNYSVSLNIPQAEIGNKYKWKLDGEKKPDTLLNKSAILRNIRTFILSNYKPEKVNKIFLTTTNTDQCVRNDTMSVPYYPNEKPNILLDSIEIYEDLLQVKIENDIKRNDTIIKGSWKAKNIITQFLNPDSIKTIALRLPPNQTKVIYTLKNYCKASDSLIIFRKIPIDSAVAGKPKSICSDSTILSATKLVDTLKGAWRSKNPKIIFADSALYNSKVSGLSQGINTLYWVAKRKKIDIDSLKITNNIPTKSRAGGKDHTCESIFTLKANTPGKNEFGSWKSLTPGVLISDTSNPNTGVLKLKEFITINQFVWTISNQACKSKDTTQIYYANKIFTRPDFIEGIAGDEIIARVDTNDLKSYQHLTNNLYITSWPAKDKPLNPIESATIRHDSIIFKTSNINIGKDSLFYALKNECGRLSDTSKIIIHTKNSKPYEKVNFKPTYNENFIFINLNQSGLDRNENVISVRSQDWFAPVISTLPDKTFQVQIDKSKFGEVISDQILKLNVCDIEFCTEISIPFNVNFEITNYNEFIVYNAISPNGDGKNEFLEIAGLKSYPNNKIEIFNRWGDRVYKESQYNNKDKRFEAKNLPDGTYYYIFDKGNGEKFIKGFIIISR